MSLYKKQIEQLVALQQVDHEIYKIRCASKLLPEDVDETEKSFSQVNAQREKIIDKMDYLGSQEKRINADIEDDKKRIEESKSRVMLVENTREYHAMIREVDNMERANRSREEEKMILMEEIQRQQELFDEIDTRFKATKAEYEGKKDSLEVKLAALNTEMSGLTKRRQASTKEVPPPILSRYEFIRERLDNPVIVPVSSSICRGCNIAIPPQTFIELQKIQQILSCPNCQRLIYWEDHFDAKDDEPVATSDAEAVAAPAKA